MKQLLVVVALVLACREKPAPAARSEAAATPPEPPAVAETVATVATTPAETTPPGVRGPKLMPVDEAARDPELVAFRETLLAAVRAGDVDAVVRLADPAIRTTFGAGGGAGDFGRMLREPGMLRELEQVLTLGGSYRADGASVSFWAPYVYSAWPDAHDPWDSLAVVSENVPLLTAPDPGSAPIAMLAYDIVKRVSPPQPIAAGATPPPFIEVLTADERRGWVATRSVRSHVAYRAGFIKHDGKWRINAFVAGD